MRPATFGVLTARLSADLGQTGPGRSVRQRGQLYDVEWDTDIGQFGYVSLVMEDGFLAKGVVGEQDFLQVPPVVV